MASNGRENKNIGQPEKRKRVEFKVQANLLEESTKTNEQSIERQKADEPLPRGEGSKIKNPALWMKISGGKVKRPS
ncbi:MAG: hypothetical protein Q8P67_21305 [archaeon]|nr:hypothetical protein [archaeon]